MKYLRPRLPEKEIELCLDLFDKQEAKKRILKYIEGVLDDAESQLKFIRDVSGVLPTDECVEQWWAEGQDQKEGFWQEAPYRTNGDVIEEIKTALKYFIETWQR